MVFELQFTNQIANAEVDDAFPEQQPREGVDTVDDLGDVLFFVQINQLELEQVGQLDLGEEVEEVGIVVRMPILQLRVAEDAQWFALDRLHELR